MTGRQAGRQAGRQGSRLEAGMEAGMEASSHVGRLHGLSPRIYVPSELPETLAF